MELALLVYVIDLLLKVNIVSWILFAVAVGLPVLTFLFVMMDVHTTTEQAQTSFKKYFKPKTIVALLTISLLIPTTQTMKYVGAAYLVQSTFESEFVQETVTLSQKAVIKQLQTWAEDNTDIQELIESVDIPLPKELTKSETSDK